MVKRKRRTFTPEFKAKVVLEALRGEFPKQECVAATTSAKTRSPNGKSNPVSAGHLPHTCGAGGTLNLDKLLGRDEPNRNEKRAGNLSPALLITDPFIFQPNTQ